MRHQSASALLLVAIAVLISAMGGCSGKTTENKWTRPELKQIPDFTSQSSLPFDDYQLDRVDLERMQAGQARILRQCTERFGVKIDFYGDFLRPEDDSTTLWGGPLGTMDLEHAASWGYHASPNEPFAGGPGFYVSDPVNVGPFLAGGNTRPKIIVYGPAKDESLPPVDNAGEPVQPGGCMAETERKIGVKLRSEVDLAAELMNLAYRDSRTKTAAAKWSACMKLAGFAFKEVQGPSESIAAAPLSAQETKLATADVKCTKTSRWSNVYYAVLGGYEEQAIARNPEMFRTNLKAQQVRLTRVEQLVSGSK